MNAGIMRIPDEVLLTLLQFPNGEILDVRRDPDFPNTIDLTIEHYEMPEVRGRLQVVEPAYTTHTDGHNWLVVREPLRHNE